MDKRKYYISLIPSFDESLQEHDDKYHGGHYDATIMSCGKREKLSEEDRIDASIDLSNHYQGMTKTKGEVRRIISKHLKDAVEDIGVRLVDFAIHGSRGRGTARDDSDLDVVFEYDDGEGEDITTPEDYVFNQMARHPLDIDGIKVDFNPINADDTGSIGDYMGRDRKYDEEKVAESKKSFGCAAPGQDAAYADAVKRGDKTTALKMIREAAAKAMPNTKVVGEDGLPLVVYHYGLIGVDGLSDEDLPLDAKSSFIPNDNQHFGTYRQAAHRQFQLMSEGAWQSEHGEIKKFFLDIRNPKKTKDGWGIANDPNVGCNVRHEGYDGNRYKNKVEGEGDESWMAYSPSQIKSADITYDDGKLIPLSKRFQMNNPDIRY